MIHLLRPQSEQHRNILQTAITLYDAWIRLDAETSRTLINKLIKMVPLESYLACKHFGYAGSDYLSSLNRVSDELVSQHFEILIASLMWKPKTRTLKKWLKLAENYDAYVCEICQGVFERDHVRLH